MRETEKWDMMIRMLKENPSVLLRLIPDEKEKKGGDAYKRPSTRS